MSQTIPTQWHAGLRENSDLQHHLLTTDGDGLPHVDANPTLRLTDDGYIELLVVAEYSATQRNLVRAIWFRQRIVIHLQDGDNALRIIGTPAKVLISGPRFEAHYRRLAAQPGFTGLSAVWLIAPEETEDVGAADAGRLPLIHLDRIARAA